MSIAYAQRPSSKKITIVELSIGQSQSFFANWAAGTWYVIFTAIYPLVDGSLLGGVSAQSIVSVGSVASDASPLIGVTSAGAVQTTEMSFFYDSGTQALYIHLQDGDEPSLHRITLGIVYGVAKQSVILNSKIYEGRVLTAPTIAKRKDPLFFGRIYFDGGWISLNNADGYFDKAAETQDLFGNMCRVLQGFDDQPYEQFAALFTGIIYSAKVGPATFDVQVKDSRAAMTVSVPTRVLDATSYPYLKSTNVGKSIPIAYGSCRNVPCTCLNETQSGPPATYTFLVADTTFHQINAVTTAYVNGVAKTINSIDLVNGVFTLTSANYTAGQTVTADIVGYQSSTGTVIQNACDVILDLLLNYQGVQYISAAFNQPEWAAATLLCPNICYFGNTATQLYQIIESICMSARLGFIVQGDGRFTARRYSPYRASAQAFTREDLLEIPTIEYDPTQVLTSTMIGYSKDWSAGTLIYLHDTSQQAAIFARYKVYLEKQYDTLLTSAADAQAFSNDILLLAGSVARRFTARMKTQAIAREVMDFSDFNVVRQKGTGLLGNLQAEITGKSANLDSGEISLEGRIVQLYPNTVYVQGEYWGDGHWGDGHWAATQNQVVA